jgi:hypothetical protein
VRRQFGPRFRPKSRRRHFNQRGKSWRTAHTDKTLAGLGCSNRNVAVQRALLPQETHPKLGETGCDNAVVLARVRRINKGAAPVGQATTLVGDSRRSR